MIKVGKKVLAGAVFAILVAGCLALAGCMSSGSTSSSMDSSSMMASSGSSSSTGYTTISVEQAKQLIDAGNITIVDVRTQSEYDQGHIPGAILVPMDTIGNTQPEALPNKDASLLVYCRTGVRSAQASAALAKLGYTHINNMDGGITAWKYDTVTGS